MKGAKLLFTLLGGLMFLLLIVQIAVGNILSTGGITLGEMQLQTLQLERENAILKEKVLSLSSLTYISQQAKKDGFVTDTAQAMVVSHNTPPLALNQ